jgi:D-alanyl-D-alanine carboxypeptidase
MVLIKGLKFAMLKGVKKYFFILIIAAIGGYFYFYHTVILPKRAQEAAEREAARVAAEIEYKKHIAEEREYLLGHFDPAKSKDFVKVPTKYLTYNRIAYLRKETYTAFSAMQNAAAKDGIKLKLASATRNFDAQKDLWDKKWSGKTLVEFKKLPISVPNGLERFKKILEYSAAPSSSRHHWGTDIDLNAATVEYFETPQGKQDYAWLVANASKFGFCQPYNQKGGDRLKGYNEEKWHWSYLPVARQLTQDYKAIVKNSDIKGFLGDQYAPQINLISDYVLSINPECL